LLYIATWNINQFFMGGWVCQTARAGVSLLLVVMSGKEE